MRFRLLSTLVTLLISLSSSLVEAQFQSFPSSNIELFIARTRRLPSDLLYINQRQCEGSDELGSDSAEIRIQITDLGDLAPDANVLEFWLGSEAENCHAPWGRTPNASGITPCVMVAPAIDSISSKRQNLYFVAHDLFASPESVAGLCDRQLVQVLYVVPLVNKTPTQVGSTPESGIGAPISIRFEVEVVPPVAVSAFSGGSGEVTAELAWDGALPDAADQFEIYFDTTAIRLANPGPCESELLRAGEPLPDQLSRLTSRTTRENRLLVDLAELGLLPGEKLPATVVVKDAAGNQSVASEVVCVEHQFVPAPDPSNGPQSACFNACAISPPGESTGTHALWAGSVLLLALVRFQARLGRFRRRRLRKSSRANA